MAFLRNYIPISLSGLDFGAFYIILFLIFGIKIENKQPVFEISVNLLIQRVYDLFSNPRQNMQLSIT